MARSASVIVLSCTLITATAALAQAPTTALAPGAKYVGLGSSFAAGPGIPAQLGTCGRSDHNYPHLVAMALSLSLTDVSCGGATTANIRNTPQNGAPPQIDAVTSDTALVTVTIGGNDIDYTSSTFACSGKPAAERCTTNLDREGISNALSQLPSRLGAIFNAIKVKAPQATIVLVTYPRVFPTDAANCSEIELSAEDISYLADLGQKLEDTFVSVASSSQVLMADAYVRSGGHGPCASSERWVNGANVADTGSRYHPTAEGHMEMARLVLAALERN